MAREFRVLHCPFNNGNEAWVLSRAERELGIKSDLITFSDHSFYQNYDRLYQIESFNVFNLIKRYQLLKAFLKQYDVFHFNFGSSILDYPIPGFNHLDLGLLKKAGKKIIVTYQGDDARDKEFFLKNFGRGPYLTSAYTFTDRLTDRIKRYRVNKMSRFADAVFALNPDLLHVLPKNAEFMPYASADLNSDKLSKRRTSNKINIVHAPSMRFTKGTDAIIKIVQELSGKFPVELILVENVTHNEALKIYEQADLAIDQLIIGWYGGFAVEMMAMGKPVVAFLRQSDLKQFVPFWREIPVINADVKTLKPVLEELLSDPEKLIVLGKKSRKFVEKYHDPQKIAKKMISIYKS